MSIEDFRKLVAGFIKSLNRDSTQYKIAKRYGFIVEIEKPVLFYFEDYERQLMNSIQNDQAFDATGDIMKNKSSSPK